MYELKYIQKEIEEFINEKKEYLNLPPDYLYEPIKYILSLGGKRLRPALVLMSYNLFSENIKDALYPAVAFEVFHNFTLLHDDIMDKAEMRRGKMTVHKKWNENIALLSGDAMLILAYKLLAKSKKGDFMQLLDLFSQTAIEVCEGQQYDMDFEERKQVECSEYIKMIRLKTSVLTAACCKAGAILASADKDSTENLYKFGLNLGLAFQLQDDILDVYGDPKIFGKKIGGDITANKKTFMLIKALENANKEQKTKLTKLIEDNKIEKQEKIKQVTAIFNEIGIKEKAEAEKQKYYKKAINALDNVNVLPEKKNHIKQLANDLLNRKN